MQETVEDAWLDIFDSEDGPTILISGPMHHKFGWLTEAINIATTRGGVIELNFKKNVLPGAILKIGCNVFPRLPLGIHIEGNRKAASWNLTSDEWITVLDYLGGVISSSAPCHQYFSLAPSDGAQLVVSRGEIGFSE